MRTSTLLFSLFTLAMVSCSGCQPDKEGSGLEAPYLLAGPVTMKRDPGQPYKYDDLKFKCVCEGFHGMVVELEYTNPDVFAGTIRAVEFTLKHPDYTGLIDKQNGREGDVRKLRIYAADAEGHFNEAPPTVMLLERNLDGSFVGDIPQLFFSNKPTQGRVTRVGPVATFLIEARADGLYVNGKLIAAI